MYTHCPECQVAFRVTVAILQKAGGRVRCGGCGNVFGVIDYLSDELPVSDGKNEDIAGTNKALLQTLDELAGSEDVRIEDTGVEWRVLNTDDVIANADEPDGDPEDLELESGDAQASLNLFHDSSETDDAPASPEPLQETQQAVPADEQRYDDDTLLSDDFKDEEQLLASTPSTELQSQDGDMDIENADVDIDPADMVLSDDEDWADLLDDDKDAAESSDKPAESEVGEDIGASSEATEISDEYVHDEEQLLDVDHDEPLDDEDALTQEDGDEPLDDEDELTKEDGDEPLDDEDELTQEDGDEPLDDEDELTQEDGDEPLDDEDELTQEDGDELLDDEDELTPEEEADIVQKLRESTGSFQKQIEAAKYTLNGDDTEVPEQATDTGDVEERNDEETEYGEFALDADDVEEEQLILVNEDDDEPWVEDETDPAPQSEVDLLSQTMILAGIDPSLMDTENIETVVMEGDFVQGSLNGVPDTVEESRASDFEKHENLVDTYMFNKTKFRGSRRKSDPVSFGVVAGVVVLVVMLLAQYVHASRQTFATYGAFNQTLGPVYRALGKPVTPLWNIKGWQFESTNGSTDESEEVLTVLSRIRNTSDKPLPYPLVHVALTDRWEEVIGSKVLEPSEYLTGDLDPRHAVAPGDTFNAVIAIERPSPEATGFQLYACYRIQPGRMRCATEDFKN